MTETLGARLEKPSPFTLVSADSQQHSAVVVDLLSAREAPYKFEVLDLQTGTVALSGTAKRRIAGAEMFGNRGCMLFLTSSYRMGMMPWHVVFALAGHPAQYNTYYIEVYGADGKMLHEALIRKDLMYAGGCLVPHAEAAPDASFGPNSQC